MRIAAADIAMESSSQVTQQREVRETLTEGFVRRGENFSKENLIAGRHEQRVRVEEKQVSKAESVYFDPRTEIAKQDVGKYSLDQLITRVSDTSGTTPWELTPEDKLKLEMLKKIFEQITGKEFSIGMLDMQGSSLNFNGEGQASGEGSAVASDMQGSLEYGLDYSFSEITTTTASMSFQAQGVVHTVDGKVLNLNLDLHLSRSASENRSLQIRVGAALKDPLVINFSGKAAELTANTLSFDIDMDGQSDTIHQLAEHSGYLALDKNNNGEIDNGSELFGAKSGDGFKELAAYDEDNNGFIDENDSIWQKLQIWVQHDDGSSSMFTLADKDIGALHLGQTSTEWDLSGGQYSRELAGQVRATGLFITEEGEAGTMQQVDLVV